MDLLLQDIRHGMRRLIASPLFTLVAVLSLALGIGANTAIFSLVNAVLLRELPVNEPDRLVEIYTKDDNGFPHAPSSYPDYMDIRAATEVFEDALAYEIFIVQVESESAAPGMTMGELVTPNYFRMLGVPAAIGRTFSLEEGVTPAKDPVVVLGHAYHQRAFGGDPTVLGRTIFLNRHPYTVIGVVSAEFKGMFRGIEADMYVPMSMVNQLMPMSQDRLGARGNRGMFIKGRLREGVTLERGAAAVSVISSRLQREYPETNAGREMSVLATSDVALHPVVDRALVPVAGLLLFVVGLVLLIACANLAGFLLARATDRRREILIRLALGAKRIQLVRQLLVESVLLALLGGAGGVLLADWVIRLLVGFQPPLPLPIRLDIAIDARALLFTLLVSTVAGILFGLAPGLHATRPQVGMALRDEAGSVTTSRRHGRLRGALVSGQVSLSLLLLVGAGLFLRSLSKAQQIDPGFDTGPAAILWPMPELSGLNETEARAVRDRLYDALRTLPGVTSVARTDRLPLGFAIQTREMQFDGVAPPPGLDAHHLDFTQVDSAYFDVMRVPIVSGRAFTGADRAGEAVAVISEEAARRFWPEGNALGQRFWLDENRDTPARVVGIARDTKVRTLGEAPRPYFYLNAEQSGVVLQFVIRGTLPAPELVRVATQAAREVYPQLVIMEAKTMEEHLGIMLYAPRMAALLLSVFGGLALALAAIGLYGTVSYAVARRTREVGIRAALGATRRELILLLTRGGMQLITIGSAVGLVLAAALTWSISGFLYGIRATDALTFLGVPLVLGLAGFLASWLPARRAANVDPLRALRTE